MVRLARSVDLRYQTGARSCAGGSRHGAARLYHVSNHQPPVMILLGITGSIAAYKAADIASQLVKAGHEVHALMTRCATGFIAPLTIQTLTRNPVLVTPEDESQSWRPGHIELADRARLMLVAPATANTLAGFANGLAPDALGSTYLALPRPTPVLLAPAMNGKMWLHPATQRNVSVLEQDGCRFVGPAEGELACGYRGPGRLAPVDEIVAAALTLAGPPPANR